MKLLEEFIMIDVNKVFQNREFHEALTEVCPNYNSVLRAKYRDFYQDNAKNCGASLYKEDTFDKNVKKWNIKKSNSISIPPDKQKYLILTGFMLDLDGTAVNSLVLAAGLQELNGRVVEEAVTLYALNNKVSYEEYVNKLLPEMKKRAGDNLHAEPIETMADLEDFYNTLQSDDVYRLTVFLNEEVNKLKTKDELLDYVLNNKGDFRTFREMPRKVIVRLILDLAQGEQIDHQITNAYPSHVQGIVDLVCLNDDKSKDESTQTIEYRQQDPYTPEGYLVHMNCIWDTLIANFQGDAYCEWSYPVKNIQTLAEQNEDHNDSMENWLYEYITGARQLTREIFIMLLIALGIVDAQIIDTYCLDCGFDPLQIDNPSIFEAILCDCLKNGEFDVDTYEDDIRDVMAFSKKNNVEIKNPFYI